MYQLEKTKDQKKILTVALAMNAYFTYRETRTVTTADFTSENTQIRGRKNKTSDVLIEKHTITTKVKMKLQGQMPGPVKSSFKCEREITDFLEY